MLKNEIFVTGRGPAISLMNDLSYRSNIFPSLLLKNRNIYLPLPYNPLHVSMKGYIGEFEELVLLTIASLGEQAYGVAIKEDIEKRSERSISIGALHSTITRLEEKNYITSWLGEPTQERGGRRKRYFQLTHQGKVELHQMKDL